MRSDQAGQVHPGLEFLCFEIPYEFPVESLAGRSDPFHRRVELAMAALASTPGSGDARLRTVAVTGKVRGRAIYSGREPVPGGGSLADAVSAADGRPCADADFVFPMTLDGVHGGASDDDVLRCAIHNVAVLVAATGSRRARSSAYLCACVVLLSSMGSSPRTRGLVDDFLRMWLRAELGGGDPPEWGHEAVARLRAIDPWAAIFMEGLGEAARRTDPLGFPATLAEVAEAAEFLIAYATLACGQTVGTA